jgi:hypothetical protein
MPTISTRVTEKLAQRLRDRAAYEDRTVSDIVNRALDEHLRTLQFPGIYFVSAAGGGRKAKLFSGCQVWSVVMVARDYKMDIAATAKHLVISEQEVRLALAYYEAYPEEIDARFKFMEEFDADPGKFCPLVQVPEDRKPADAAAA